MTNPRVRWAVGAVALLSLSLSACGSGFDDTDDAGGQAPAGPASVNVLISSSGDAETKAVTDVAQAWATGSGNTANVTQAQDMVQQLGQGFASNNPPDVFYLDATRFATYASAGSLEPYGDTFPEKDDFYASARQVFTYDGKLYCIPKDFSTLALQINTKAWSAAGLTDADYPTTWEQLQAVATKLTTPEQAGLAVGDTRDRIGAFMVQAGGWVTDKDATKVTTDSPQNLKALEFVRSLLASGAAKYRWSGEAFGKQKAAMTIEGNWIAGAMKSDYPDIAYTTVPLPAGPQGKGTLAFTQCWGIAAKSAHKAAALDFVKAMTAKDSQLTFAKAFGVMPSRQSAQADYVAAFPQDKAFIEGATYAQAPVNVAKIEPVLEDFDTGLQGLPNTDPAQILKRLQTNAEAVVGK